MRVLTFTTIFPRSSTDRLGIFIKRRIALLARLCDLKVMAPVRCAYISRTSKNVRSLRHQFLDGLEVFRPRYFVFPGLFKSLDGLLLFALTFRAIRKLKRKWDFDIIDAHWAYPDGFAAYLMAKALGKPVSVTRRGSD